MCALGEQGFPSKPRAASEGGFLEGADETEASRAAELRAGVLNLGLAWGLVALCCTHHAGHMLHGTGLHEVTGSWSGVGQGHRHHHRQGHGQGECQRSGPAPGDPTTYRHLAADDHPSNKVCFTYLAAPMSSSFSGPCCCHCPLDWRLVALPSKD